MVGSGGAEYTPRSVQLSLSSDLTKFEIVDVATVTLVRDALRDPGQLNKRREKEWHKP